MYLYSIEKKINTIPYLDYFVCNLLHTALYVIYYTLYVNFYNN